MLALRPGLAVLADYGQIVPPALLDLPHGALNLHPSALPRFRGASPVRAAILAGDAVTAVTLMRMDEGLDSGPIVAQEPAAAGRDETAPELEGRLAALGADAPGPVPARVAGRLASGAAAGGGGRDDDPSAPPRGRPPRSPASGAPRSSARSARTCHGPAPSSRLDGERLVVGAASVAPSEPGDVPGSLVPHGDRPALATADGRLVLDAVTPPGRRPMSGADYLRGRRRPA